MGNRFDGSFNTITTTGTSTATSGTAAQIAIPNASDGNKPKYVRVSASAAACVKMGKTTATATINDTMVTASVVLQVPAGYDVISAIQVSAAGVVQVSALENQ